MKVLLSLFILCFLTNEVLSARILGLFPHIGHSHFTVFLPLLEELHKRGHELVVVSHFPRSEPISNYTDISLKGTTQDLNGELDFSYFDTEWKSYLPVAAIAQLYMLLNAYENVLKVPDLKKLIDSREKFDLVLTENFNTDMLLAVPYLLNAPFIGLTSGGPMPWTASRVDLPDNPAYIQSLYAIEEPPFSFWQRFRSSVALWIHKLVYEVLFQRYSQRIAEENLGPLPPLSDIARNTSLILLNTHFTLVKPRPLPPNVIEMSGIHMKPAKKLPQEIQQILDEAPHGVIYFSMGSLLRGNKLPVERRKVFLDVFGKLKQRVIWKWEGELPGKPSNVYTFKWMPQRDILEHPNVLLYITHGGMSGVVEAVYCGVPMIGIPIFGDQPYNIQQIVDAGAGIRISFHNITHSSVEEAITTVLENQSFKRNAKKLSERFKDRPMSALETAVYWTEYVIRHKGAPFLKSAGVQLPWYQYYHVDVLIALSFFIFMCMICHYHFWRMIFRKTVHNETTKKKAH